MEQCKTCAVCVGIQLGKIEEHQKHNHELLHEILKKQITMDHKLDYLIKKTLSPEELQELTGKLNNISTNLNKAAV